MLLDTHAFLWWVDDPTLLSGAAQLAIADPMNRVLVSVASLWEIAIKRAIGKLVAPVDLRTGVVDAGFELLPIEGDHLVSFERLPFHHRDPFDRMLVAQAQSLGATLVTRDTRLLPYGIPLLTA